MCETTVRLQASERLLPGVSTGCSGSRVWITSRPTERRRLS